MGNVEWVKGKNMIIKFTKRQAEFLDHRFTAPDCMSEALDNPAVHQIAERLSFEIRQSSHSVFINTGLEAEVLIEAFEGSTLQRAAENEPAEIRRPLQRVANSIYKIFSTKFCFGIVYPGGGLTTQELAIRRNSLKYLFPNVIHFGEKMKGTAA